MKLTAVVVLLGGAVLLACSGGGSTGTALGEGGGEGSGAGNRDGTGEGASEGSRADTAGESGTNDAANGGDGNPSGTSSTPTEPAPASSGMKCTTTKEGKCWCDNFTANLPDTSCAATYSCCVLSTSPTASLCSCSNVSENECMQWVKALKGSRKASCP